MLMEILVGQRARSGISEQQQKPKLHTLRHDVKHMDFLLDQQKWQDAYNKQYKHQNLTPALECRPLQMI